MIWTCNKDHLDFSEFSWTLWPIKISFRIHIFGIPYWIRWARQLNQFFILFRCYWCPGYCAFSMSRQKNELFWNCHMVTHNSPGITLSKVWKIWFPSGVLAFWHLVFKHSSALERTMAQWNFCLSANKSTNDSAAWQWWLLFSIVIGWNICIMSKFSSCCPKPVSEGNQMVSTSVQWLLSHGVYIFDQLQIYTVLLNLWEIHRMVGPLVQLDSKMPQERIFYSFLIY